MGLEVGWYTRLSRAQVIEALVRENGVEQILNHLAPDEGWQVEVERMPRSDSEGGRLVRLTRRLPGCQARFDPKVKTP